MAVTDVPMWAEETLSSQGLNSGWKKKSENKKQLFIILNKGISRTEFYIYQIGLLNFDFVLLFLRKEIYLLEYFNLWQRPWNLPSSLLPTVTTRIVITIGRALTALQARSSICIGCVVSQIYLLLIPFSSLGLINCHLITLQFKQTTIWSWISCLLSLLRCLWRANGCEEQLKRFHSLRPVGVTILPRWWLKPLVKQHLVLMQQFSVHLKQFEMTDFLSQRLNQSR